MRLTLFSDYALRMLMFAAARPGQSVTIGGVSEAYGVSRNHLMKVANLLASAGYLETARGKGGGLRLARPAAEITVGAVLRLTEAGSPLVECFGRDSGCVIEPACGLKHALSDALQAFYARLDRTTLADITPNPGALNAIFEIREKLTA